MSPSLLLRVDGAYTRKTPRMPESTSTMMTTAARHRTPERTSTMKAAAGQDAFVENAPTEAKMPPPDTSRLGYVGLDIGGSLAKCVFFEPDNTSEAESIRKFVLESTVYGSSGVRDSDLSIRTDRGTYHFLVWHTRRMQSAVNMILERGLVSGLGKLVATGGGAEKFKGLFEKKLLDVKVTRIDEMTSMVKGLSELLQCVPDECYYFEDGVRKTSTTEMTLEENGPYPYLVCSVGSGISIIKVTGPESFERVTGTAIGGATFFGLVKLLTGITDFNEAMKAAERGKGENVNMTVGDIYGGPYEALGLDSSVTASFFGKFVMDDELRSSANPDDICQALLFMVTNNAGQLAYNVAKLHNLKHIYFIGNFLRNNATSARYLAEAINFWTGGAMRAFFCRHEGFFGCLGAYLAQEHAAADGAPLKNRAREDGNSSCGP